MDKPSQIEADDDAREAVVEACCREACKVNGIAPDTLMRDVDNPGSDDAPRLIPAWQNFRRKVLETLAIVGTASHAVTHQQEMVRAGNLAGALGAAGITGRPL